MALLLFAVLTGVAQEQPQEPTPPPQTQDSATAQASRVTVHGTVRNEATGDPLPRALVQIEGDAETGVLTDGEGHFELNGVPVGPQTIRVVKPGFRDRPFAAEEPGAQGEGPPHSVMVAAQMPDLSFTLTPNCAIHGRIELSTGDSASGLTVLVLKRVVHSGREIWAIQGTARTNGDGSYRVGGLPDGVYVAWTQPSLESEPAVSVVATGSGANVALNGYPSIFYPDARDLAGASKIRLSGGTQAEVNFSLALEPFYPVTAVAILPGDSSGKMGRQGGYTATVMDASGQLTPYPAQFDGTTHSVQANLPNGTYTLVFHGNSPERVSNGLEILGGPGGGGRGFAGETEFTVAGHAVLGLRIPVGPPQAATLRLRLVHAAEGAPGPAFSAGQSAELVNLSVDSASGAPSTGSDNLWSMNNQQDSISFTAQPGAYWVSVSMQQKGICAGSFTAGGLNLSRDPLPLSLVASPPQMELTLRDDCGTLALALPQALATFLPGEEPFYTVYVVPDFDTVQDIPPMNMHASSGPTLTVDGLTPGSYHVYTFDSPMHLEYRNPAALAALPNAGQQVTVSAGTVANLVLEAPAH
ncbi:MAG: carboxypeptidase regulatory-like domain-containing protein [Terracidiphilus sp.]